MRCLVLSKTAGVAITRTVRMQPRGAKKLVLCHGTPSLFDVMLGPALTAAFLYAIGLSVGLQLYGVMYTELSVLQGRIYGCVVYGH